MDQFKRKIYSKAPVIEALIHFEFQSEPENFSSKLDIFCEYIAQDYPDCSTIQFMPVDLSNAASSQRNIGYRLANSSNDRILQLREQSFTFSCLAPYTKWEDMILQALNVWKSYQDLMQNAPLTRVAVRYVNQLNLPLSKLDLKSYLNIYPVISSEPPLDLGGYLMQLQIPFPKDNALATVIQVLEPQNLPEVASTLLDIEVTSTGELADEDLQALLNRLHKIENQVFETSITDRTRELFK